MTKAALSDADDFQLRKLVSKLNMADWSPELDQTLQDCVVQSYFNFDLVCVEVNQKARALAYKTATPIGARDRFNVEHCRLRWSYLHLVVSREHPILSFVFFTPEESWSTAWLLPRRLDKRLELSRQNHWQGEQGLIK